MAKRPFGLPNYKSFVIPPLKPGEKDLIPLEVFENIKRGELSARMLSYRYTGNGVLIECKAPLNPSGYKGFRSCFVLFNNHEEARDYALKSEHGIAIENFANILPHGYKDYKRFLRVMNERAATRLEFDRPEQAFAFYDGVMPFCRYKLPCEQGIVAIASELKIYSRTEIEVIY